MDLNEFTYSLLEGIDKYSLEKFLQEIQTKVDDSCGRLHFIINSSGGSISIALAWASLLQSLPCQVVTYNMANVDSAAVILFAAGERRIWAKHALCLMHEASKEINGMKTSKQLYMLADEIKQDSMRMTLFLQERTNTQSSIWIQKMNTNACLSAQDALELGLATDVKEIPAYPL